MGAPRSRRLIWRIYLNSVLFVLIPAVALFALKRALSEPPWRSSFERSGRYVISEIASERGSPETLRRELERVERELGGAVALYARDGRAIAATPGAPGPISAADLARLERGEIIVRTDDRLVAAPIVDGGRLTAYGVFTTPKRSSTSQFLLFALLVALSATGVASFLLARSFTRPLAQLAGSAARIGAGDLNARSNLRRKDEFGEVARAFDDMAERVAQLLRSQKELLANVSHELRTPLSRIQVALDIAAEGNPDGARELLGEIALDLAELERLIDDILTAARLDLGSDRAALAAPPLRLERVQPSAVLERAAARFATVHPGRRLTVEAGDLPDIVADAALLRRAIDNLLDNAAKYSEPPAPIVLRARRGGESLVVEVIDRGIGVDAADLPHLFTPFFRGDRSRARGTGGVGLGLALVKRIVDAHGGEIAIESAAGQTTARVAVPIMETATPPPTPG